MTKDFYLNQKCLTSMTLAFYFKCFKARCSVPRPAILNLVSSMKQEGNLQINPHKSDITQPRRFGIGAGAKIMNSLKQTNCQGLVHPKKRKETIGTGVDWRAISSQAFGLLNLRVITESGLEGSAISSYVVKPVLRCCPAKKNSESFSQLPNNEAYPFWVNEEGDVNKEAGSFPLCSLSLLLLKIGFASKGWGCSSK